MHQLLGIAVLDVDGDGLLENVRVILCNGRVLLAEINEYDRNPFFSISFYANSYQKWNEGVADYLQDIQDLKTEYQKLQCRF